MRATIVALLLLASCGGSDTDPHAVAACEGWMDNQGNPFTGMCEAACEMPPPSTGTACDTVKELNCNAFTFEGVEGCCIQDDTTIRFYECQ